MGCRGVSCAEAFRSAKKSRPLTMDHFFYQFNSYLLSLSVPLLPVESSKKGPAHPEVIPLYQQTETSRVQVEPARIKPAPL